PRARLPRRDGPVDLPDPVGAVADRRQAGEPMVDPAAVTVGGGREAGSAGARESARDTVDGPQRRGRRHSRHPGRRLDRLLRVARLHQDAHLRGRVALPARRRRHAGRHSLGSSTPRYVSTATAPTSTARPARIARLWPLSRTDCANARPSSRATPATIPTPMTITGASTISRCHSGGVPSISSNRSYPETGSMADTNYTSGDDYIVEFLGYRFSFNAFDFEQRVVGAAVKLGLVEANELDEDETADLVALAAQGLIETPESRLGRYLSRNWERVALVGGESLVYWLRKLVFRGAWLDHQVKRGALEIVWDDGDAEFAYQHPDGGRPLLELAPIPSWHELQYRG